MKRLVPTLLLGIFAFLGGYATSALTKVSALEQAPAAPAGAGPRRPLRTVTTGQATFLFRVKT